MELVGADRKLLKAFYTQYTSVLLIILTFTIGAFQRTLHARTPASIELQWAPRATVGTVVLKNVFTREGAVGSANKELLAVAEVLSQHDLNARVFLYLEDLGLGDNSAGIRRARTRLHSIHKFLVMHGAPSYALTLATKQVASASEELEIQFVEAEG